MLIDTSQSPKTHVDWHKSHNIALPYKIQLRLQFNPKRKQNTHQVLPQKLCISGNGCLNGQSNKHGQCLQANYSWLDQGKCKLNLSLT